MPCSTNCSKTMAKAAGSFLLPDSLMLAVFVGMAICFGRAVLPLEEPPAFLVEPGDEIWVELGQGFGSVRACQLIDEPTPASIIYLTEASLVSSDILADPAWSRPFENGERLDIVLEAGKITEFRRSWMSAWSRLTLAVPLEPSKMDRSDWSALPGIGEKLAARIEQDRQENGEFNDLSSLQRVSGIGPKRIAAWLKFF